MPLCNPYSSRGFRPLVRLGSFLVALALAVGASLAVAELPPDVQQRLLTDLKYLASDELEGRGLGSEGLDLAADAIRDDFADAGLDVTTAGGDAFQEFEVVVGTELESPNELTLVNPQGERIALEYDAAFRTCSFGAAGEFSAPLVFCGYGIVAPK